MAFKMTPKSPVLLATGRFGSPAKQTKEGGSISNTQGSDSGELTKKGATKPLTALQRAQQEAAAAQVSNQVANIQRNTSGTKKETARLKKRTARNNSATERKEKNAKKTQARVDERKKSGKTRVGKVVAEIKKAVSPAKQKRTMDEAYAKRDMDIYGDLDKNEYKREAKRQNKVIAGKKKLYTKLGDGTMQTKKDKFGNTDLNTPGLEPNMRNTKGESMNSGNTGGRKITGDVPKTKMKSKTKKVTTLKAEGPKNEKAALPTAKPIKTKEIKVTKKVTKAKPTRSQKIRAKGEAALASGNTGKAQRLRKRMDRVDARKAKRAARKEARA